MAKPKKIEGAKPASPSLGTTTPDAGASTALASPVLASSLDENEAGLPILPMSVELTDEPIAEVDEPAKEPLVEEAAKVSAETTTPTLHVDGEEEFPLGATLPQEVPGVPGGITVDELREMGIPLPGAVLSCPSFEDGQPEHGVAVSISVELDVVTCWLRRTGRMWPVPIARVEGTDWTHVAEDYPPPTTVASFDRLHRTATAPPPNAPVEWLSPSELSDPAEALASPVLASSSLAERIAAEVSSARVEHAERLTAFYGRPVNTLTDAEVILCLREVIGIPGEKEPIAPKVLDPLHVALGIPEHYTLCEIKGLGSISGHGRRASDGKVMEEHIGGTRVYFPDHTVRKLKDILETDPTKFKSRA